MAPCSVAGCDGHPCGLSSADVHSPSHDSKEVPMAMNAMADKIDFGEQHLLDIMVPLDPDDEP